MKLDTEYQLYLYDFHGGAIIYAQSCESGTKLFIPASIYLLPAIPSFRFQTILRTSRTLRIL